MSKKLYPETDIQNIANAIRNLNGSSDTYTVSEMASAIALPENGYYLKESASANPLSITDGEELKCQSALVTFAPIQSGTGDPSPTNIRPISGWDGLNLNQSGKNLLAKPFVYDDSVGFNLTDYFFIKAGTYTFAFDTISATSWRYVVRMKDKNGDDLSNEAYIPLSTLQWSSTRHGWINRTNITNKTCSLTFVTDCYIRITFAVGDTSASTTVTKAQLEIGSTATAYEPYNGQTHTATFAEPVAGGSYDFVSGKLIIDTLYHTFTSLEYYGTYGKDNAPLFYGELLEFIKPYYDATYPTDDKPVSNMYKAISAEIITDMNNNEMRTRSDAQNKRVYFRDDRFDNKTDMDNWLANNPIQFCGKLYTPREITLTPQEIELLKGSNTVWTDGDTVQLEYWSKSLT